MFGGITFAFNSPPARRGFHPIPIRRGWDESAQASRGRTRANTCIYLLIRAYTIYSTNFRAMCVHHAYEWAVHA